MKLLSLKVDLDGLNLRDAEVKDMTSQELMVRVIKNIILSYGQKQRGLGEEERRKFYKLSDALEKAAEEKKEEVELEDDWFGFLKKCKRESTLFPDSLLRKVEEAIDAVPDR